MELRCHGNKVAQFKQQRLVSTPPPTHKHPTPPHTHLNGINLMHIVYVFGNTIEAIKKSVN